MRPILLLESAAVAASARGSTSRISRRGWNLPTAQKSVAAFVQRVSRGGDQAGDGYDDPYDDSGCSNSDDPYNDPYNQQYGNGDNYGDQQPHDYQDERYREDRYDDRGREGVAKSPFQVPNVIKKGDRRIGLTLLGAGWFMTFLGISLLFNEALMRLGNLLFMAGVPMTIGPSRTAAYFLQPKNARATGCLTFGICLVFFGFPVIGIMLEAFGLIYLLGNMFPFAMGILKQMPGRVRVLSADDDGGVDDASTDDDDGDPPSVGGGLMLARKRRSAVSSDDDVSDGVVSW